MYEKIDLHTFGTQILEYLHKLTILLTVIFGVKFVVGKIHTRNGDDCENGDDYENGYENENREIM